MFRKKSFSGGAHPREEKHWTEHQSIETLPLPGEVIIPLQQHIGAPAEPIVEKSETVKTGQALGKTNKFVSVPSHASLSGTVKAVESRPHPLGTDLLSIIIESDGNDTRVNSFETDADYFNLSKEEMKKRIQDAGIAGMGGAAFPTHVKLSPPPEKPIDTVFLNGVECEPYLTADHRLMLEKPTAILNGLRIIMKILDVHTAIIGIEKNKPDAIRLMREMTASDKTMTVLPLNVKYPQGAEKQLIKAGTGREVPSGGLPFDVGCLVHNVGTALSIYEAVSSRKPLIERVVTVTGPGVKSQKNLLVRIGTPFRNLIEFCGGYANSAAKLINGGPMMGISQVTDEVPVIKGTSGILVLDEKAARMKPEEPCISCARCVDVCPMKLLPSRIAGFVEYGRVVHAVEIGLLDCIECGTCGFICPSKRNLVHYIKLGKALHNEKQQAAV
ncbi:MAG: electron transport complex subunit RsxC [bacterium]